MLVISSNKGDNNQVNMINLKLVRKWYYSEDIRKQVKILNILKKEIHFKNLIKENWRMIFAKRGKFKLKLKIVLISIQVSLSIKRNLNILMIHFIKIVHLWILNQTLTKILCLILKQISIIHNMFKLTPTVWTKPIRTMAYLNQKTNVNI